MTNENDLKSETAVGESIDKLNRYFDNLFEDVTNFDGSRAAVFRPHSGYLLADVVLTFTEWTDNWRIDLQRPSIMDSMKLALGNVRIFNIILKLFERIINNLFK
jgi:hypothetical protein